MKSRKQQEQSMRQRDMFDSQAKLDQQQQLNAAYDKERAKLRKAIAQDEQELQEIQNKIQSHDESARGKGRLATLNQRTDELESNIQANQAKLQSLEEKKRLGLRCIEQARVTEGPEGEITITGPVGPPQPRLGFENENRSGLQSDPKYDRLHARGARLGFECDCGIRYGSPELNQAFQNQGIERHIAELYEQKRDGYELMLTQEIRTHPQTSNLESIHYDLHVIHPDGKSERVYALSLNEQNGRIFPSDIEHGNAWNDDSWKRDAPTNQATQQSKHRSPSSPKVSNKEKDTMFEDRKKKTKAVSSGPSTQSAGSFGGGGKNGSNDFNLSKENFSAGLDKIRQDFRAKQTKK